MIGMPMIVAEGLSKSYGGRRAIDGVSFTIAEGEIVGLLGLNGAGKSTILKILGCFLLPSSGTARVGGYSVDSDPQSIRRLIGYLPDVPPLYDEMTVDSYLAYVARLKNVASADVARSVGVAKDKTNLDEVGSSRISELSHGFRQRVGIAQAIVHNPKVIILDEPINGLDPVQIVEMRDLILSLRGHHTVVLSSHILSEITKTCDRVLVVDHGRLVAEGSEVDLQSRMVATMRLSLDVSQVPTGFAEQLKAVEGVAGVSYVPGQGIERFYIEASRDVRAQVASLTVNSGAGLLGLSRGEAGLEGLFMKLIKPVEERVHG
jgi:ABC-2 type transport system ATP-binding protein